uniref:Uncharacterized protein n=1 Tax=Arundo donax TaxID=35708 RepID=A0A0A9BLQ4_ARUDO
MSCTLVLQECSSKIKILHVQPKCLLHCLPTTMWFQFRAVSV